MRPMTLNYFRFLVKKVNPFRPLGRQEDQDIRFGTRDKVLNDCYKDHGCCPESFGVLRNFDL